VPKTVGDVIAERIRRFRKARDMTIPQLSEACIALGSAGMTPASLTNLERPSRGVRSRRQVSIDELLTLAYVLQVPPLSILLPIGEDVEVELVPGTPAVDVAHALTWLTGDSSHGLDGKNPPDLSAWLALARLKEHNRLLVNATAEHYARQIQNAEPGRNDALVRLGWNQEAAKALGIQLPELPDFLKYSPTEGSSDG
jgi:transcriptional regulator with XRE-family HTH domain